MKPDCCISENPKPRIGPPANLQEMLQEMAGCPTILQTMDRNSQSCLSYPKLLNRWQANACRDPELWLDCESLQLANIDFGFPYSIAVNRPNDPSSATGPKTREVKHDK